VPGTEPIEGLERLRLELGLLDAAAVQRLIKLRDGLQALGRWVVLVGAGVSRGAGLPSWEELTYKIAARFGVPVPGNRPVAENNYPDLLQECLSAAGTAELFWDAVADELCHGEPTETHSLLLGLPFEAFITLNLDCLLDRAHEDLLDVESPRIISYPQHVRSVELRGRRLIHLHGKCNEDPAGPRLDDESTVLTKDAYYRAYDVRHISNVIQQMVLDYQVFFVGTSLADWQIRNLLARVQAEARIEAEVLRSDLSPRRHMSGFALVESDEDSTEKAQWLWPGTALGIEPIFYLNPDQHHEALPRVLRWLASELAPLAERERYEADRA
jgi:hypothetical protein